MSKYRVILPVEIEGRRYDHGDEVELDVETAAARAHALIALEETREEDGGSS